MFDGSRQTSSLLLKLHHARPVTPFLQTKTSILHSGAGAGDEDEQKKEMGFKTVLMDSCQVSLSPLGSRLSGCFTERAPPVFIEADAYTVFVCCHYKVSNNMIIFSFFLAVLPAGAVVVARSSAVASTNTVPLSDDRHLHWPDPHFRLPSPPL